MMICDPTELPTLNLEDIELTPAGRIWYDTAMNARSDIRSGMLPGERLKAFYGCRRDIPPPTVSVEPNKTLCFWWKLGDTIVRIRFTYYIDWEEKEHVK